MNKILWLLVCIVIIQCSGNAQTVYDDNYTENPNYIKGMEYLDNSQYSSAINEFKKAVRTNPKDESALIGLSNAYNLRAKYYNDEAKDLEKAILDIKSALFFNKYFRQVSSTNLVMAVNQMEKNLYTLETAAKHSLDADELLKRAKLERIKGEFAAAGFDYFRLSVNSSYKAEANSALGDIYKIFNRPDRAIVFYKNALSVTPDNADIHLKLARVYEDVDDFNSSLKEYSYSLDNSSEREDILNSLEKIWQKRADENPNDAEIRTNLGVVYQKEKRYNEALNEYKKAETLNPGNINTKINIGTLYQEQKKYDLALSVYNLILQSQPNNTNILIYKAQCLKELNKTDEAINTYKDVLKIDSKNTIAKSELLDLLQKTMPVEDVLSYLYQNVLNSPQDSNAYYEFAYELHKAGKIDDAITYYTQAIKTNNDNIDAYINLSQCYRQKQKYAEASSVINRAREIAPDNNLVKEQFEAINNEFTANMYNDAANEYEKGNYENAILIYSKIKPETSDSLLGIAGSYQALGNNEKAVENYISAMNKDITNADIPYYIAAIYANNNDIGNAEKYVKMALEKNPNHTQAKELNNYISSKNTEKLIEQAVKIYEDEDYTQAVSLFDKIIQMTPNDANVYYYRALSYDALKNYQKAINDYKTAVKLSPEMNIAFYSIAVDYDNLKDYKSAKEFYTKYSESITDDNEYKQYALNRIKEITQ